MLDRAMESLMAANTQPLPRPTTHASWRHSLSSAPTAPASHTRAFAGFISNVCIKVARHATADEAAHCARQSGPPRPLHCNHPRPRAATPAPTRVGIYYTQTRNLLHGAPSLAAPRCSTLAADVMVRSVNAASDGAGQLAPLRQRLCACPTSYFFLASASHSSWNSA